MGLAGVYLIALVAFFVIDAIALKYLLYPLFSRHIGGLLRDEPFVAVAAGFYVFYVAGVLYFASLPALNGGGLGQAALNGAILGFLAYGTYEATNMATLKGWSWQMLAVDLTWGTVLTATVAAIGYLAGRLVL